MKGSGKWGRKGEECAAGGTEWFDSDCIAVLAKSLLDVYKHCSESFRCDLMAQGVKCVFLSGSLSAQVGFSGLKAGGAAANSRPCVWFLSLVFAIGSSSLPVVILLWYFLAIGKGH